MDCSAPSHYLKQFWVFVNWTLKNKLQWNSNQNTTHFSQENAFENVSEMASILSRGRWVKLINDTKRLSQSLLGWNPIHRSANYLGIHIRKKWIDKTLLGTKSISHKTPYRKISQILDDWLSKCLYRFEIWQAHRRQYYRNACSISEQLENVNPYSRFRDFARSFDKTS